MRVLTTIATALLLALPCVAQAWDAGGHMLIDEIAARRLKPEVAGKVEALLPLLDNRFNGGHPYNLVTVGTWMDDMRRMPGYSWAAWHYIDLPCDNSGAFVEPPPPHALWAIDQALEVLNNHAASANDRAEALGWLIHLVADVHQPLHTATHRDRGGNGYLIAPLTPSGHVSNKPLNLHWFWDAAYRFAAPEGHIAELWPVPSEDERPTRPGEPGVIAEQATALLNEHPPGGMAMLSGPDAANPRAWVRDTHNLACQHGWPPGPPPADYEAARLTPQFVQASHEIVGKQIVLAGCRLADLLNRVFSETKADGGSANSAK